MKGIRVITQKEIDRKRWDDCIKNAINGMVYGFSWYLDIVAEEWHGLVSGDYDYVMPIFPRKKWGINYLYQPFWTQQSGIFSPYQLNEKIVSQFMQAIPKKYKLVQLNLNTLNSVQPIPSFSAFRRKTYHLDLISPYNALYRKFNTNTQRNIKKAHQARLFPDENININQFITFVRDRYTTQVPELKPKDYIRLQRLVSYAIRYGMGKITGVFSEQNELVAVAFIIWSHRKPIFLVSASSDYGKKVSAMFFLVDEFIKKYAENTLTLDFEGSDIDSIARFYNGFGAVPTQYFTIFKNRLPFCIKWLKPSPNFEPEY